MNYNPEAQSWRKHFSFPGLFYTNFLLITLAANFNSWSYSPMVYFFVRLVSSTAAGILFDYVPTTIFLAVLYGVGAVAEYWSFLGIAIVTTAQEVIMLSYISEIVTDNCKFVALSEVIILQLISASFGHLISLFYSHEILAKLFFVCSSIILLIVNASLFDEIPKNKRPNFIESSEKTVFPKIIGLLVSNILMATVGTYISAFKYFFTPSSDYIPDILMICVTPVVFFLTYRFIKIKDIKYLMLIFLGISLGTWLLLFVDSLFYLGFLGMIFTVWFLKCSTLVIYSRILGPFHYGKFFGFALGLENVLPALCIGDWMTVYIIGICLGALSLLSLGFGMKYCEYHRDYVIGQTIFDRSNLKKNNFKIKLKRASVLETN